jgi:hypothetical protein
MEENVRSSLELHHGESLPGADTLLRGLKVPPPGSTVSTTFVALSGNYICRETLPDGLKIGYLIW